MRTLIEPTREEIHDALSSAIDNEAAWVETFEYNEPNDPNYPEAAEQSRRHEAVLRWLRDQFPLTQPPTTADRTEGGVDDGT